MIRYLILLSFAHSFLPMPAQEKVLQITPDGTGLTIQETINQIPALKDSFQAIEIRLAEGTYFLDKPLVIKPRHGGDDNTSISFRGVGEVIISAGRKISFLQSEDDSFFSAGHDSSISANDLYVQGLRYNMARTPNEGFLQLLGVREVINEKPKDKRQPSILYLTLDNQITSDLRQLSAQELSQVRIQFIHKWDQTIRVLDGFDQSTGEFFTRPAGKMKKHNPLRKGTRYFVQGYAAAKDNAGEWYQNKGQFELKPMAVHSIGEAVIPVHTRFLNIHGEVNNKVRKVSFENIVFQHSRANLAGYGWNPNQAGANLGAAFWARNADSIQVKNCSFEHLGLYAIWLEKGVTNSHVIGNYFRDLGAGAIKIGSTKRGTEAEENVAQYNVVENNIIQTGGLNYPCSVGIWIGNSSNNKILHNDISDFRYTGISVGWRLGYGATNAHNNEIAYNKIHHLGWSVMADMAGIYTLGESIGTHIHHNIVHDITGYRQGYGLYEDEGSSDIVFEKNLTYRTSDAGFMHHYGRDNLVRNNVFGLGLKSQLESGRIENHQSFSFSENLIYCESDQVFHGNWKKLRASFKNNTIVNSKKVVNLGEFIPLSLKQHNDSFIGQATTATLESFIDWSKQKFANFGFDIPDWENAGVYGSDDWKQLARLPEEVISEFENRHITLLGKSQNMYSDHIDFEED